MKPWQVAMYGAIGMVLGYGIILVIDGPQPWYYWVFNGLLMGVVGWKLKWFK